MAMQAGSVRSAAMRRALVTGLLAVGLLTAGACGSDDTGEAAPDATQRPASTTATTSPRASDTTVLAPPDTSVAADEAAVRAAVDCYWQTIVEANDPPNPDHPGFDRCFTGPALERSRQNVIDRRSDGERVYEPDGTVDVVARTVTWDTASSAIVRECLVDDSIRVRLSDGAVIDDATVTLVIDLTVTNVHERWLVSSNQTLNSTPGSVPCDG